MNNKIILFWWFLLFLWVIVLVAASVFKFLNDRFLIIWVPTIIFILNSINDSKKAIKQCYDNAIRDLGSESETVIKHGVEDLYELAFKHRYKIENICKKICDCLQTKSSASQRTSNSTRRISPATVQFILDLLIEKKNGKKIPNGKEIPFLSKWLDLSNVYFQGANLNNTNLQGVLLQGANLSDVQLVEADLKDVILDNAQLQGANFTDAKGLTADQLRGAEDSNLERVCLAKLKLNGGDFSNFKLNEANSREADLKGVTLDKAEIQGANFTGVKNFTAAQLDKANPNMEGVCLAGLNLSGGNFSNFKLCQA